MTTYQMPRSTRREARTIVGRFRGGKLVPVMAVPIRPSEGGMLSQSMTLELDPIAGRLITPITGEMISVFVPVQAMDALRYPDADYSGLTEVVREKLLSGNPLFGMDNESEISRRCGVNPRSVGGVKQVSLMLRIAHNAAVNHLRVRKYHKAAQLLWNNTAITPAIISNTILERLNGVLDPDDRINGQVQLQLPTVQLPVYGMGTTANPAGAGGNLASVKETGGVTRAYAKGYAASVAGNGVAMNVNADGHPMIYAQLNEVYAGGVSLLDMYNAEKKDALVRTMRTIVDENPQYGEEMVLRWAHGLNVDPGKIPVVIHEERLQFGRSIVGATDTAGVDSKNMRSDMMLAMNFTVPVPKTELGGIIITFACLKPDETLSAQPHPILSDVWGLDNFVADELALDPVPVTIREIDSECTAAQESTVSLYTGLNALKQTYVHYGLCRQLDPTTIENKTAVWQLKIPMSVTPDTILYPANLEHYPFADQLAEVCTYTISSNLVLQSPMIVGPSPVEALAIIDQEDLFEEDA